MLDTVGEGIPEFPPPHPGPLMARVLMRNFKLEARAVSERSEIPLALLENIVQGKAKIDENLSFKLRSVFGNAADKLLAMQQIHDFYVENGRRPTREERDNLLSHAGSANQFRR